MSAKGRILVVDDEPAMLENCGRLLAGDGYDCCTLEDPLRFRDVLHECRPDVLLLDMRMPGADGMTILSAALADEPSLPVIVITAYASLGSAVQTTREGAFDYLAKPFSADQLLLAVERALRYRGLTLENRELRAQVDRAGIDGIVGSSPQFLRLLEQARKVAVTDANVLVTGESGTGKEVLARLIHAHSPRHLKPLVPVDCAALPEGLLESELFGHERGAFTGAVARKDGLLSQANGGTVFLDEITELSIALQSKLLRTLEERQVRRLGSAELVAVDIRIIAAANIDLEAAVAAGTFRSDLFYRLNVVPFQLPPLREREGDAALLLHTFLRQFAEGLEREPPRVSPDVWDALERHPWPGNVREVRNLAQLLVAMDDDGRITVADLPERLRGPLPAAGGRPGDDAAGDSAGTASLTDYQTARDHALRAFQARYLRRLLDVHRGNVSRAAMTAGVSRRTLHRWIAELPPGEREGLR